MLAIRIGARLGAATALVGLTNRQGALPRLRFMATFPSETILSSRAAALPGAAGHDPLVAAWAALHGRAAQLAVLARLACGPQVDETTIVAALTKAQPWQRALVAQGIEDIAALLDTGLEALATLSRRGQDSAAPALTLWREFHAARSAVLGVVSSSQTA